MQDARPNLGGTTEASTGVYVGCVWQEYQVLLERMQVQPTVAILTGSGMNFMVGRVSYTFCLQGEPESSQSRVCCCNLPPPLHQQVSVSALDKSKPRYACQADLHDALS
jgi:hypothetical protein